MPHPRTISTDSSTAFLAICFGCPPCLDSLNWAWIWLAPQFRQKSLCHWCSSLSADLLQFEGSWPGSQLLFVTRFERESLIKLCWTSEAAWLPLETWFWLCSSICHSQRKTLRSELSRRHWPHNFISEKLLCPLKCCLLMGSVTQRTQSYCRCWQ